MKTHTTHVSEATETMAFIANQNNRDIATIKRHVMENDEFNDADWHRWLSLINAAPDMLAALQRITHPMADDEDVENALAVIKKAKEFVFHWEDKHAAL